MREDIRRFEPGWLPAFTCDSCEDIRLPVATGVRASLGGAHLERWRANSVARACSGLRHRELVLNRLEFAAPRDWLVVAVVVGGGRLPAGLAGRYCRKGRGPAMVNLDLRASGRWKWPAPSAPMVVPVPKPGACVAADPGLRQLCARTPLKRPGEIAICAPTTSACRLPWEEATDSIAWIKPVQQDRAADHARDHRIAPAGGGCCSPLWLMRRVPLLPGVKPGRPMLRCWSCTRFGFCTRGSLGDWFAYRRRQPAAGPFLLHAEKVFSLSGGILPKRPVERCAACQRQWLEPGFAFRVAAFAPYLRSALIACLSAHSTRPSCRAFGIGAAALSDWHHQQQSLLVCWRNCLRLAACLRPVNADRCCRHAVSPAGIPAGHRRHVQLLYSRRSGPGRGTSEMACEHRSTASAERRFFRERFSSLPGTLVMAAGRFSPVASETNPPVRWWSARTPHGRWPPITPEPG